MKRIPSSIYKYYKLNESFDKSRLYGNVFFSSPLGFNDPYDCGLEIENNTNDLLKIKDKIWLERKLIEIGFHNTEVNEVIDGLINNDIEIVHRVRNRQLEKIGILCLTEVPDNILMWAYYTEHQGYCVEYDGDKLINQIIIGFINSLSERETILLFVNGKYSESPDIRSKGDKKLLLCNDVIQDSDYSRITNPYLKGYSNLEKINFARNLYIKRFEFDKMNYVKDIDSSNAKLFYQKNETDSYKAIKYKYYTKLKDWENEKEFRIVLSLGGNKVIKLETSCIKSITFGHNISTNIIFQIISILKINPDIKKIKIKKIRKGRKKLITKILQRDELIDLHDKFNSVESL